MRKIRAMRKCSPSLYFKSSKKGFTSQLLFDFLVCWSLKMKRSETKHISVLWVKQIYVFPLKVGRK